MRRKSIWNDIELAIRADKRNNPSWPDHAAGQAGKVVQPCGELMVHCMQFKYDCQDLKLLDEVMKQRMKDAAIRTAAAAIRFLENLNMDNAKANRQKDKAAD